MWHGHKTKTTNKHDAGLIVIQVAEGLKKSMYRIEAVAWTMFVRSLYGRSLCRVTALARLYVCMASSSTSIVV